MTSAMRLARTTGGSSCAGWSSGMRQSSGSGAGLGRDRRPQLDDALQVAANRLVVWGRLLRRLRRRARPVRFGTSCRRRRESSATTGTKRSAGTSANGRSASRWRFSNARFISANIWGAAPWKAKIDCFSSPTANTVRFLGRAPSAGEKLGAERRKNAPLRRQTRPGPRRAAGDRARSRACAAPRRRSTASPAPARARSGR